MLAFALAFSGYGACVPLQVGVATPAVLTEKLADSCSDYITSVVLMVSLDELESLTCWPSSVSVTVRFFTNGLAGCFGCADRPELRVHATPSLPTSLNAEQQPAALDNKMTPVVIY